MKKTLFILLAVVALSVTSCSSAFRAMREPNVRFELNSNDYTLSEPVTGEAEVTRVLGIDWERLFHVKAGAVKTPILSSFFIMSEDSYAIYDMMEKNPGYDFVMYPQVEKKSSGFPFIFEKTQVKVTARLGKFSK